MKPLHRMYEEVGGKTMTFVWACLLIATVLCITRRLTADWVTVCIGLAGVVAGRSVFQDRWGGPMDWNRPRPNVEVSTYVAADSGGGISPGPPARDWRQAK